jgi:hypothetical protein
MNWLAKNPTARGNERWLRMWIVSTVLCSIYLGLGIAMVLIAIARENRGWLLAGLFMAGLGIWNTRSSAQKVRWTAAKMAEKS